MRTFIIRRLLLMVPTIFIVTILVFLSVRFIPGNVIDLMIAEMAHESGLGAQLTADYIRHALGLDIPVHIQYAHWLWAVFHGDLGTSLWTGRSILQEIIARLPVTLELASVALTTALIIALPIGVYSGVRQDTLGDYGGRSFAILCISLPTFWVGTMVIVFPSIWWDWSPQVRYISFMTDPMANLQQFIIPGFILGMMISGQTMRMLRTMMLEVLRQDYIRTAWSKGLREKHIIFRHALKNAAIPVITIIGVQIATLFGGSVVIEQIFNLPGIGRYLLEALNKRDYTIISGINLIVTTFVLLINLVIDLAYAYLDPRIQYK